MSGLRCEDCGKFMSLETGASSADRYDFVSLCLDYEHFRCRSCSKQLGAVTSNAHPNDGDMRKYERTY